MPKNINVDPPPSRRPLIQTGNTADFVWHKWFQRIYDIVTGAQGTYLNYIFLDDTGTTYTVLASDNLIVAKPENAQIDVQLTPGEDGKVYNIHNIADTGANAVVITPDGTEEIERTTSVSLSKNDSVTIMFVSPENGWFII